VTWKDRIMKLTIEISPEELHKLPNYIRPDSVIGSLINELLIQKTTLNWTKENE